MLKIISYIGDFFTFILDMFKLLGNILLSFVRILANCVVFLYDVVSGLPAMLVVAVTALVVIAVLYKVLGRENQS